VLSENKKVLCYRGAQFFADIVIKGKMKRFMVILLKVGGCSRGARAEARITGRGAYHKNHSLQSRVSLHARLLHAFIPLP